ncbi:hypothetical protein PIB30_033587 [Stylosanthes scabra]|uniref:Uncharacterized protein n=1 Tax=Stylosanthes scabra TaxID=79078 RepID=A0ABU6YD69_9FABA|nr:hypothetical protein [Stylosanthes scabra]
MVEIESITACHSLPRNDCATHFLCSYSELGWSVAPLYSNTPSYHSSLWRRKEEMGYLWTCFRRGSHGITSIYHIEDGDDDYAKFEESCLYQTYIYFASLLLLLLLLDMQNSAK